jgi:hypothetical protein
MATRHQCSATIRTADLAGRALILGQLLLISP